MAMKMVVRRRRRKSTGFQGLAQSALRKSGCRFFALSALYAFGIDHVFCEWAIPPDLSVI